LESPIEPEVRSVVGRILAARHGCFIDFGANLR
jgi:hypothetical protein